VYCWGFNTVSDYFVRLVLVLCWKSAVSSLSNKAVSFSPLNADSVSISISIVSIKHRIAFANKKSGAIASLPNYNAFATRPMCCIPCSIWIHG
jgi:hypothetical protein